MILCVCIIAGLVYARNHSTPREVAVAVSPYDSFAQCLADKGAKFYGTFWCPHCKEQKELFKQSKKLPYIECSDTSGQNQLAVCKEAGIESYPTWIFTDGSRLTGKQEFSKLAEKTGCVAPTE